MHQRKGTRKRCSAREPGPSNPALRASTRERGPPCSGQKCKHTHLLTYDEHKNKLYSDSGLEKSIELNIQSSRRFTVPQHDLCLDGGEASKLSSVQGTALVLDGTVVGIFAGETLFRCRLVVKGRGLGLYRLVLPAERQVVILCKRAVAERPIKPKQCIFPARNVVSDVFRTKLKDTGLYSMPEHQKYSCLSSRRALSFHNMLRCKCSHI